MFFSRLAVLVLLTAAYAGAWPIFLPRIYASHAAFGTSNVAPGSFISIQQEFAGQFLPAELAEVKIELKTSDGALYSLPAVEPPKEFPRKEYYVWAVIPPDAALGTATITLGGSLSANIQIVPAAPGLFTLNYLGYGTAIALDRSATRLGLVNAALPQQEISLWGTGLGGATNSAITVEIGGLAAQITYVGSQVIPGLDQINVMVPKNAPQSCYVPVRIRVKGIESNPGYVPISDNPSQCSHPLDLTYTDRQKLDSGDTLLVSRLTIRGTYNATYAGEVAELDFSDMNASDVFRATVLQGADVNSCVAVGATDDNFSYLYGSFPFAGALTGPDGRQMTVKTVDDTNASEAPDPKPFFNRGEWNFASLPSPKFAAVQQDFYMPAPLREFSPGIFITFTSGQDMLFTWDASRFTKNETITVQVGVGNLAPECRVFADQGRLVFPAALFEKHKGHNIGIQLLVRPVKRAAFTIYSDDGARIPAVIDPVFTAPLRGYVQ